MLIVFSPISVSNTKLVFTYNFIAPLNNVLYSYLHYSGDEVDGF